MSQLAAIGMEERPRRSPRVVGRRIAGEFLLVPLAGRGADVDALFNLNRVGTAIWELLDGSRDGHAVVEQLTRRFAVEREEAARDYRDFVAQLVTIGAVEPPPGPAQE